MSMTEVATTMRTRLLPVGALEVDDMRRVPLVALLVLPVQQGSDVFDAGKHQHNCRADPSGDKHEFQNFYQYDAKTHDTVWYLIEGKTCARFCWGRSLRLAGEFLCYFVCYAGACLKSTGAHGD